TPLTGFSRAPPSVDRPGQAGIDTRVDYPSWSHFRGPAPPATAYTVSDWGPNRRHPDPAGGPGSLFGLLADAAKSYGQALALATNDAEPRFLEQPARERPPAPYDAP